MIEMSDSAITYPNRQQMLELIRARTASGAEDCDDHTDGRAMAESEPPFPNCIFVLAD
jgi:hypothetical protein